MSLLFGIPTLDTLIGSISRNNTVAAKSQSDSASAGLADKAKPEVAKRIALLGPDGAGKSVLALHLASRYAADSARAYRHPETRIVDKSSMPLIIYVSSDLKEKSADDIWEAFDLGHPDGRHIPFEGSHDMATRYLSQPSEEWKLETFQPNDPAKIAGFFLREPETQGKIGFLDLASHTAGDDWNYVNTLLAKLACISAKAPDGSTMPHLVIIDSVEGFETFVGKLDAFGNEQTRRSRVAQCIRNAGSRIHLVFVVEEPQSSEHLPEEYVTDIVLRLRKRTTSGNSLLTIEVQKARGREHAKGEHPIEIRSEHGTSTGNWENADTPRARNAYVQVFHSLAHRNRTISAQPQRTPENLQTYKTWARFGLPFLDELLPDGGALKPGTATGLLGDPSTGKSALGEKFLAEGFNQLVTNFVCLSLLEDNWHLNHDRPFVKRAFARVFGALSASILPQPLAATDSQPTQAPKFDDLTEREIDSCCTSNAYTQDGWFDSLMNAVETGLKATEDPLKRSVHLRQGEPPQLEAALKGWPEREKASCLAKTEDNKSARSRSALATDWMAPQGKDRLLKLFRHPNLTAPGVLLTTSDRRGSDVARRCSELLLASIPRELKQLNITITKSDPLFEQIVTVLDRQLIVRRFELEPMPAAAVLEVIQRNLAEANKLIFGLAYPSLQNDRYYKAGRVRLVLDDLRVLANINPEIAKDGSFLPFLSFVLERSGMVSLLIDTDSVRPNMAPQDEMTRALLTVVKRAVLTWNVPFDGRSRIAIGVVTPHWQSTKNGLVRELTLEEATPSVTRNFELYSGVEEGRPVPVPLAIYIFKETSAFEKYVNEEDTLFRELFSSVEHASPVTPGRVIFPVEAPRYLALRDFTHLSLNAQDAHTMVFQVDEFWALKEPHLLDNLKTYLTGRTEDDPAMQYPPPVNDEDPFRLFQGQPLCLGPDATAKNPYQRSDYFHNSGYDFPFDRNRTEFRVPFMWDFGFVLVRSAPWRMAADEVVYVPIDEEMLLRNRRSGNGAIPSTLDAIIASTIPLAAELTVDKVLCGLALPPTSQTPNPLAAGLTSWRKFFGACTKIAEVHQRQTGAATPPFDIASPSPETMNSLLLEIWRSEIAIESVLLNVPEPKETASLIELLGADPETHRDSKRSIRTRFSDFKNRFESKVDKKNKLNRKSSWAERQEAFAKLPLGAFCLYKVWLLLLEVLPFEEFVDAADPFTFRTHRMPSMHSVASRHWYKTACTFSQELYQSDGIHDSLVAMRMPGKYSMRGDWYLGTPKSSRSKLLAQHALDLLCSRRANLARMQQGLGLPVRDIAMNSACKEFRTALRCKLRRPDDGHEAGKAIQLSTEIKYGELVELGAHHSSKDFAWLLRSDIDGYDRLGRPLQKWLVRLFHWTRDYKVRRAREWTGGFPAYDELTCKYFDLTQRYDSFVAFGELCDLLLDELDAAQRAPRREVK
jgi:KaiC/GvpD/RAD55 family RecA-like ATPase